jgi:TetR/AcrR family transcriptional regulator of autoinduction and epiphytic fitness
VSLLEEGDPSPTAKTVAARAAVSVRLVFHHFADMESLYRAVLSLQASQYWDAVRSVPADQPVEDRIDQTVQQRAKLFDAVGAVRRAGVTLASRQPDIAEQIAESDARLRSWLEETFAPELRSAGRERRELLSALDTAASWEAWDRMRRGEHLSAAASRRVMTRTIRSLLA